MNHTTSTFVAYTYTTLRPLHDVDGLLYLERLPQGHGYRAWIKDGNGDLKPVSVDATRHPNANLAIPTILTDVNSQITNGVIKVAKLLEEPVSRIMPDNGLTYYRINDASFTTYEHDSRLHLIYLPFNCIWVFTTTGRDIVPILDQRYFLTREDAAKALEPLNMQLQPDNSVTTTGPNPCGQR
ncbi:hypothetical protein CSQ85_08815 [Bifidobacterium rousetti]|uniref:hypothetical protein n=1 Tax=Bifidobacterium rousetti TaxID=2045439 RepID=UPI00123C6C5A|nr:hypothetical protein [Bifidobacterium rousetti]KAA8818252.1 hypothetical protein CSQ85_08815 [Bifidobacterium rousetti]